MKTAVLTLAVLLLFPLVALNADEVPRAVLDLALEPPVINTRPGPEYDDRVRTGNMIIGIERTPKGRLWACWVGNGDNPNGFFMLATSDDGGATWSKPVRIAAGCTLNKPTVLSRRMGTLARPGEDKKADGQECPSYECEWLLPVSLWPRERISIGTSPGRPADYLNDAHHDLDALRMANVFVSTDQGQTWSRRGGMAFPQPEFDEHMIVELKDGRLWMLARTKNELTESYSSDRGSTWTEPQHSSIKNYNAKLPPLK